MKINKPIFKNSEDWTFEMIEQFHDLGEKYIAELGFTHYPLQIEIVSAEQMMGLYASHAMPFYYPHWSFGEQYLYDYNQYYAGKKGLAYEICKNTDPCLCFCMETNSAIEQASVIFHVFGHSSHFASNYLYKNNSDSKNLIPYMDYVCKFIAKCSEKYGHEAVEHMLDLCHSLQYSSFNKHKRFKTDENKKMLERELYNISHQNYLLDKLCASKNAQPIIIDPDNIVREEINLPEENILYFIEKHSPVLTKWQREICRIIRKLAQFSYQNINGQSQIMAEGTAMFTECYMMKRAHEDGYIDEGSYIEYLDMNSKVLRQFEINKRIKDPFPYMQYGKLNPYFIGLHVMRDIKRMCENPTEEDIEFNSDICNTDWRKTLNTAISDFRDESFIRQFLSPYLIRKLQMMHVEYDNEFPTQYLVKSHAEFYNDIRNALADINCIGNYIPNIEISNYTVGENSEIELVYHPVMQKELHQSNAEKTINNIAELMGCQASLSYGE